MSEIKAIETVYNGYRFRSRLEARWAVFFDAGNIKYQYEPEGFDLGNGVYYLPDFYLPDFDCYVEVKADTGAGRKDIENKCEKAIIWGGPIKRILVLSDVPEGRSPDGGIWHFPFLYWNDCTYWGWWFFHDSYDGESDFVTGTRSSAAYSNSKWWCLFKKESIKAISDYEISPRINTDPVEIMRGYQEAINPRTFMAFRIARQARFEHGETPQITDLPFC